MPERTPGSGSRAPTVLGCTRACTSQHIDSVTVLHPKDLVQGFCQNTALSWRPVRFRSSGSRGECPGGRSPLPPYPLCIQANARSGRLHMQLHMQNAVQGSVHGQAPARPAGDSPCAVRTIRLSTPEKDKNAESAGIVGASRAEASTHAKPAMRKEIDKSDLGRNRYRTAHITEQVISPLSAR